MEELFTILALITGSINGYRSKTYESEIFWIGFILGCVVCLIISSIL